MIGRKAGIPLQTDGVINLQARFLWWIYEPKEKETWNWILTHNATMNWSFGMRQLTWLDLKATENGEQILGVYRSASINLEFNQDPVPNHPGTWLNYCPETEIWSIGDDRIIPRSSFNHTSKNGQIWGEESAQNRRDPALPGVLWELQRNDGLIDCNRLVTPLEERSWNIKKQMHVNWYSALSHTIE